VSNPIGWCSATLNPVVGCYGPGGTEAKPNRCPWCYAVRQAPRVAAMIAARFGRPVCQDCREFRPHLHPERLDQIGNGRGNLFVGSMCDLWSDGVLAAWRDMIWGRIWDTARPVTVLTKCPERINPGEILDDDEWPDNLWVGTSACNIADVDNRWPQLSNAVPATRRVLSMEPLYSWPGRISPAPAWLIIGPQTPLRSHAPIHECDLLRAIDWADGNSVPLWLKDGCYAQYPDLPRRQELPEGMVGIHGD
jgi:protein gp37